MEIKIYNVINNHKVNSDKIVIYDDLYKLQDAIIRDSNNGNDLAKFVYLEPMLNLAKRNELFINIMRNENDIIKNYLILGNGDIKAISDFVKIETNLKILQQYGINKLKNSNVDLAELRDKCLNIIDTSKDILEQMKYVVILGTVFEIMDNDIEDHRVQIQNDMIVNIKELREKEVIKQEEIIKTELDLINMNIKKLLKTKEEREELEILSCEYNGQEISQEEIVRELTSHVFPEFLTEKNIEDTVDDYYVIKTNKIEIIRDQGGKIHMIPLKNTNDN